MRMLFASWREREGAGVRRPDVVVVGAGGSGAVLAARLSEDPGCRVLVLEAGPVPRYGFPPGVLDARTVPGAEEAHPLVRRYAVRLTADRGYAAPRGRVLGGSTTVNGGYFIRAREADFARWAAQAGDARWSYERVLPVLRAMENDADFGPGPLHGGTGPMPVRRTGTSHAAFAAFAAAAEELGHATDPDKNAQDPPGFGPVPTNTRGARRVNTGLAYLMAARDRPNLAIRGDCAVRSVVVRGAHATGVVVERAGRRTLVQTGEIVLCAGAFATPHLLHLSGIGPAGQLAAIGIPVVADLPAVGAAVSDHPQIAVPWQPRRPPGAPGHTWLGGVLHVPSGAGHDAGDLEILQPLVPLSALTTGSVTGPGPMAFLVSVQTPRRGGALRTVSPDPDAPPSIAYDYLSTAADRGRMREAVRTAAGIIGTAAFAEVAAGPADPSPNVVEDDQALDAWIRDRLGTAQHTCGTVPMGPSGAVDAHGRVHGLTGLRVADTSVLPDAPMRGPAATAVLVGELAAESLRHG